VAAAGVVAPAAAQMMGPAKLSGQPSPQEAKFIAEATRYLERRYATTAEAKRAGFVEFTPEDKTGAISWANRRWSSTDAEHPSQVWYDVGGRLIGADYSVLQENSPQAPHLWGIEPQRWIKLSTHIHYGIKQPDGSVKFGAMRANRFVDAGGSVQAPTKQMLVNMGLAKSPDDVAFVFLFPAIWDLQFWVIPNPDGAFAEANPNVKPRNAQAHPS
jgi:hypothetical protein